MIDKLKVFMKKKYDYNMKEFKVCSPEKESNKKVLWPVYVFIVVLIGYAIQVLDLIPDIYGIVVVGIVGGLLMIYQIVLIKKDKSESLVVTPDYLIKCFGTNTFVVVKYNEIRKFNVNEKEGLIISDRKNEICISPVCYQADLEPIVDILEAKGKTFDKSRDYMKRPVEIRIVKNKIIVRDVKQEESSTEKLVGEYYEEFKMLTPGFIKDIIFLNSVVDDVFAADGNLILNVDKIEVKEGHPENTGFESIIASDCIVIFENVDLQYVNTKKVRDNNAKEEVLSKDLEAIVTNIEKGVIVNWKYRKNGIDLHFAVGVNLLKASFNYKEVIVGWKSSK